MRKTNWKASFLKETSQLHWQEIRAKCPTGTDLEIWWADEARIGKEQDQRAAGQRREPGPSAPHDQRTMMGLISSARSARRRAGELASSFLLRHRGDAEHLAEISNAVDPGSRYGAHSRPPDGITPKLKVPDNITLMFLPPRSPECEPGREPLAVHEGQLAVECVFKDYDDIVHHCCAALGTGSLISRGRSCPSECATGRIGHDQRTLVLGS